MPLPPAKKRVLIVEDDEEIAKMTKLYLFLKSGFEVTLAESIATAEPFLGLSNPDVLLLDINLPVKDGPSLLRTSDAIALLHSSRNLYVTWFRREKNGSSALKRSFGLHKQVYGLREHRNLAATMHSIEGKGQGDI